MPSNEAAKIALEDPSYYEAMFRYNQEVAEQLDPIWNDLYRTP